MPYPETTDAFAVDDIKNWSTFKRQELPLKKFEDYDVDIAVDACGVCASDVHTITGGWGDDIPLPLCVGHEVIGRVVKVGSKVTKHKVGDRVGSGAQVGADLTCDQCKADQENYCPNQVDAYGAKHPDGTVAQGGYSSHVRVHEYFVFQIPENLETHIAAPMLCAGITTFSPLKRLGAGPGKKVGIIGLGGLGHFGVLWSVALGAETTVISHTAGKKEDALKMGAKDFIVTNKKGWADDYKFKFDFVINTADATDKFDLSEYFSILKVNGTFHMVGFPDNPLPAMPAQTFAPNGCYMGASHIGNRPEMEEMLQIASKQNIKSWIETIDISEEGCKQAVERVYKNDNVRYRFTLTNFDKVFGECLEQLQKDLEWKLTYVGSATSNEYDQELDSVLVGPLPVGVNKFQFKADPPNLSRIPNSEIIGVTVILLSCSYDEREFVRVGYYVNNEYTDEALALDPPTKPVIEKVQRQILAEKPRVTRFAIKWDSDESAPPEFPPEQPEADLTADGDQYGIEEEEEEEEEGEGAAAEGEDAAMAGAEDTAGPANDEDAESEAGSEEIDIEDSEDDEEEEGEEGGDDDMEMDEGEAGAANGDKPAQQQPGGAPQQQSGADVMVH